MNLPEAAGRIVKSLGADEGAAAHVLFLTAMLQGDTAVPPLTIARTANSYSVAGRSPSTTTQVSVELT